MAFTTGVTGRDGSFLSEFFSYKGYIVYIIKRCSSSFNTELIDHIYQFKPILLQMVGVRSFYKAGFQHHSQQALDGEANVVMPKV